MITARKQKEYPRHIAERIIATQMRMVPEDGELYENAIRNVYAAFDIAEQFTGRIIVRSLVTFGFAEASACLDIPPAPVLEVVAVRYYDADDNLATLDPADYELIASEDCTYLDIYRSLALSTTRTRNRLLVEAWCGYDDYRDVVLRVPEHADGIVLPGSIEAAVQLTAGTLCEADGDAIIGRSVNSLPLTAERLLRPYRMSPYGAND